MFHPCSRYLRPLAAAALLLAAAARPLPAAAGAVFFEYQVKAEFLVRIAQFVDWPPDAFSGVDEPFVIAVMGEDPFGAYLDEVAARNTVKGRGITVRRLGRGDKIGRCHMLFISGRRIPRLPEILSKASGRPILTLGDGKTFAEDGACMGLYTESGRVRFHVNLAAARRNRLTVSTALLRLASDVYEGGK